MGRAAGPGRHGLARRISKDLAHNGGAYVMVLPVVAFFLLFAYKPMFGAILAFKDFVPSKGIFRSAWTSQFGFQHFLSFFQSFYFTRVVRNTVTISMAGLLFGFPVPILLAMSLNEVRNRWFRQTVQTISYMPHFISLVVICAMIRLFTSEVSFIVPVLNFFGYHGTGNLLNKVNAFVPIYVVSDIWQQMGWNCIIYLAALSAIDQELYEAARIDGAGRLRQTLHVTLPGIMGTVLLLLILRLGNTMSVGYEKIILLYNDFVMEKADVISSFVYRRGLVNGDWSFGTAVGLFNSLINFVLVMAANRLSNRFTGLGIW